MPATALRPAFPCRLSHTIPEAARHARSNPTSQRRVHLSAGEQHISLYPHYPILHQTPIRPAPQHWPRCTPSLPAFPSSSHPAPPQCPTSATTARCFRAHSLISAHDRPPSRTPSARPTQLAPPHRATMPGWRTPATQLVSNLVTCPLPAVMPRLDAPRSCMPSCHTPHSGL